MSPTLQRGDKLLANKLAYHVAPIRRGQIVVFYAPQSATSPGVDSRIIFTKRIIGLPGETIQIRAGEGVYINGRLLHEAFPLPESDWPVPEAGEVLSAYRIPPGHYFVLGDNRLNSRDSRHHGCIPREDITGRVTMIFWPAEHMRVFSATGYP